MVYRFKLVSDEVSNFAREIEIDASASFLDLRNAVLDSVGYTKDEMNSFYLCDDQWGVHEEITLEDMGDTASDRDLWLMDETSLDELIEEEGQKLMFVFDYMTERSFFMEMKEEIPGRTLHEPVCTLKRGNPPAQSMDIEEFDYKLEEATRKTATDLDAEFFGDSEFNEDELPEGLNDLEF